MDDGLGFLKVILDLSIVIVLVPMIYLLYSYMM